MQNERIEEDSVWIVLYLKIPNINTHSTNK